MAERMDRARAVWRRAEPSAFEVAVAQKRIAARGRSWARAARSIRFLAVPVVAASVLLVGELARRRAPPIEPVSELQPAPAILEPLRVPHSSPELAAPPAALSAAAPPAALSAAAPPDAAAQDASRLAAAEALHRAGQCRTAKPVIEELAARGATPGLRARAQALLDEMARLPPPP